MTEIKIRLAKLGDEEQLAGVHVKSWQEAYAGLVPQAYLDQLPSELDERIGNWKKTLENPKRFVWVAEGPAGIVGFVLFGSPRDKNREDYIELGAIYLLASEKGKKIGFSLLSAGFNKMRDLGYKKAYCWVLENNPTIRFYERSGARFSGLTKDDGIGGKHFKEFAYDWDSLNIGDSRKARPTLDLTTERLTLRAYRTEDWERVHIYGSNPDFSKYELWGPNTLEDTRKFVGEMVEQSISSPRFKFDFAVCLKQSGLLIGGCGIRRETELSQVANLGWAITPEFQSKGYATESAKALIDFGFKDLKLSIIYATCDTRNTASFKVMEKLGMKKVGFIKGTKEVKKHIRESFRYEVLHP